ncbi:MAG: esterase-like activity of phytase family protein [Sphingosinicella sp.]
MELGLDLPPQRGLRILALLLILGLLTTPVRPGPTRLDSGSVVSTVSAEPVLLDESNPGRRQVGPLRFVRGWNLDSPERRFGGLSAIQVEGDAVIAVSDAGSLLHFPLPRRAGRYPLQLQPLLPAVRSKAQQDSEALAVAGNEAWVAFERMNGIARFDRARWQLRAVARPPAMRQWRGNNGAEALVRLPDGRFLVFAELRSGTRFSRVLLFHGDPARPGTRVTNLRFRRPRGFQVSDAALLPDGRLLVLCRRFRLLEGFSASLTIARLPAVRERAVIQGREIARFEAPLIVDNFEGVSVAREGGRTLVRLASDDNFMTMQRTLLLEFELVEPPQPGQRPAA